MSTFKELAEQKYKQTELSKEEAPPTQRKFRSFVSAKSTANNNDQDKSTLEGKLAAEAPSQTPHQPDTIPNSKDTNETHQTETQSNPNSNSTDEQPKKRSFAIAKSLIRPPILQKQNKSYDQLLSEIQAENKKKQLQQMKAESIQPTVEEQTGYFKLSLDEGQSFFLLFGFQ